MLSNKTENLKTRKIMNKPLLAIIFIMLLSNFICAQNSPLSGYGSSSVIEEISSDYGSSYKIHITLPPNYDSLKTYKSIYYLDAWWLSDIVKGANALNYLAGHTEAVILIGVSIDGDQNAWHQHRNYDYTPSPYNIERMKISMSGGTALMNDETTGNGPLFYEFLKDSLIPFIESKYKCDSSSRTLLGHSLGGLFGYYALMSQDYTFMNYILLSPSLWWNKSEFINESAIKNISKPVQVYFAYGSSENILITKSNKRAIGLIKLVANDNIHFINKTFEGLNHNSILPSAIYDSINELYPLK